MYPGHACQEEIKLIYSLVHPKYAIPVHGEFRHRMAQKELAESMGIPKENMHDAVIPVMWWRSARIAARSSTMCQSGGILVDGLGVGDVGNIVLRDRQNLAQNGIIIVVLTLEKYSNQLLSGPDIVSRGFVYVRESEDLMEEAQAIVDACRGRLPGAACYRLGQDQEHHPRQLKRFLMEADQEKPDDPSDHHGSITTVPKDGTKEPYEQTDKGNQ